MARIVATKDGYITAALDILARDGHGALRIGVLCRRLGVTTGSFYHYFGSFDGFVDELLSSWEQELTQRIFEQAMTVSDPEQRVRLLKERALTLPHEAEGAIRAWSHVNAAVATVQRRVDDERLTALRVVLTPVAGDTAPLLASMALSILVGYQQRRTPVDLDELRDALDLFEQLALHRAALPLR
ncbi:TetR/AcrR family transcriptional regulator [uncultured Jatrophihabitans sp.]|uniref:TetR/AcrR family transcriptional regulator n=1 Tax=uncultured Jatrophihabitans sp. TaxID=1610747 RepID=UPI0035CB6390